MEEYNYVVGIDQSYKNSALTLFYKGQLLTTMEITDLKYKPQNYRPTPLDKLEIRMGIEDAIEEIVDVIDEHRDAYDLYEKPLSKCIIFERVRLISGGSINEQYIRDMQMMVAHIIRAAYTFDFDVYSVDTRSWKSKVVGTSKPLENNVYVDPKKYPTIKYCIDNGYEDTVKDYLPFRTKKKKFLVDNKGKFIYNDNIADAICIGLYGFHKDRKLQEEL